MADDNFLDQDCGVSLPSDYSMEFFLSKGFRFLDASEYRNHVMNHSEFTATSGMGLKTNQFDWSFRQHIRAADHLRMKHTQFLEGEILTLNAREPDFEIVTDLKLNWFRLSKHALDKFYQIDKEALFLLQNKQFIQLMDELTDHRILIRKHGQSLQFRFQFSKYLPENNFVFYELLNLIRSEIQGSV